MRRGADQQHIDTLAALGKTDAEISALETQAGIMGGQLEVTREEFNATQRPWISIDSVQISATLLFLGSGDINLSLQYRVTNSGRTPAIYVSPTSIGVFTKQHDVSEILRKTIDYCEEQRIAKFPPKQGGILVPPGKTLTYPTNWILTITKNDIEQFKERVRGRDAIVPYIGGCMNYQFTFGGKKRHQTGFIYQLVGPDTFIFLDSGNISSEKLNLLDQAGAWAD
jgi:hypothetical protein